MNMKELKKTKIPGLRCAKIGAFALFFAVLSLMVLSCDNPWIAGVLPDRQPPPLEDFFDVIMLTDGAGTAIARANGDEGTEISVVPGTEVTIEAEPGSPTHRFIQWNVETGDVMLTNTPTAAFLMPAADVTITAVFKNLPPDTPYLVLEPGLVNFGELEFGYAQPDAISVTIRNNGSGIATVSDIALGGDNYDSFNLGGTGLITTINGGEYAIFTVQPNVDLSPGTHNATITVTYDGGETVVVNVVVVVGDEPPPPPVPYLELSPLLIDFDEIEFGSARPAEKTVTITNTGTASAVISDIALGGVNYESFELSGTTQIETIAAGNYVTFTVRPAEGLAVGTHNATITVTYNGEKETVTASVVIVVTEPGAPSLELTPYPTIDFGALEVGYTQPGAQTVTITNTGTASAAISGIALGGTNYGSFELSGTASITTIGEGNSETFTVRPNAALPAGTYNATIIVTYNGGATATTNVTFTVSALPTFAVTMANVGQNGTTTVANQIAGANVSINAGTNPGYTFVNWTSNPAVTFDNPNNAITTFEMPDSAVTITANWTPTPHAVTMVGVGSDGTTTVANQIAGATVSINAGTNPGYNFVDWTSNPAVTFADSNSAVTTFEMPGSAVTITANWTPVLHAVNMIGVGQDGTPTVANQAAGTNVSINAGTNPGYNFVDWTSNPSVTFANPNSAATTFEMPGSAVTITANWTPVLHTVTMTDIGQGGTATVANQAAGATVQINAGTRHGYTFENWTSNPSVTFANSNSAATTFEMPGSAVTITANWTPDSFTVTMQTQGGGTVTAQADSIQIGATIQVIHGTVVTITAAPADGYRFGEWILPGNVTLSNVTTAPYTATFIMPIDNVTITAYFEELPTTGLVFAFNPITAGATMPLPDDYVINLNDSPESGFTLSVTGGTFESVQWTFRDNVHSGATFEVLRSMFNLTDVGTNFISVVAVIMENGNPVPYGTTIQFRVTNE